MEMAVAGIWAPREANGSSMPGPVSHQLRGVEHNRVNSRSLSFLICTMGRPHVVRLQRKNRGVARSGAGPGSSWPVALDMKPAFQ